MTNVFSPDQAHCPFVAGGMITDPRLFVGRKRELRDIALRMEGVQPISMNVYGERRIGKSSLLYHFYQTWRQRVQDSSRYAVVYLTLQHGSITTEPALYGAIAAALRPALPRRLHPALHQANDRSGFARLMETCCQQGILPVLCIDEFETLFRHRQAFDDDFYDAMRALMDRNQMMLVLASQRPVDVYSQQQRLTSRFFNLGHTLRLGELSDEEADELVRLPARAGGDAPPALNRRQQLLARRWGGCHPYRLQLVCTEIVNLLNRERRRRAVAADVDAAIVEAFERGAQYFREFWQNLSDHERRALRTLAHTGAPPDDASPALLNALVRREVLRAADGTYAFQVPMMRRWVRERSETADPPSPPA